MIGINQRNGEPRFFRAEDAKSGTLAQYIKQNASGDVDVIMAYELPAYPGAMAKAGLRSVPLKKSASLPKRDEFQIHSSKFKDVVFGYPASHGYRRSTDL